MENEQFENAILTTLYTACHDFDQDEKDIYIQGWEDGKANKKKKSIKLIGRELFDAYKTGYNHGKHKITILYVKYNKEKI